ncbi:MAG: DUF2238 domain-containing protein [Minisyncoccales bacterium]
MIIKKGQLPILISIVLLIIIFSYLSLERKNYEFLMYIGIIIILAGIFIITNKKSKISNRVLWGMVLWAFMHMSGGLLFIKDQKLYTIVLIDLFKIGNETVFRYDQLVHIVGFGIATYLIYELIRDYLNDKTNWKILSMVLIFAGMGIGVVNEILEFIAVVILPETGVGGYENTLLDLISNTIGAIIVVIFINIKNYLKNR